MDDDFIYAERWYVSWGWVCAACFAVGVLLGALLG
jgi:hypothetical protein